MESLAQNLLGATFAASFQGTAQVFQASMQGMALLILIAILVIYIMLGILYESFIHPITILSGLPSAGFGAGAGARRLLGVAGAGGLFFSQIVTLYITPVY